MRAPPAPLRRVLGALVLVLPVLGACRARLPVDRPGAAQPPPAPPAVVERLRIEYYQISDG